MRTEYLRKRPELIWICCNCATVS